MYFYITKLKKKKQLKLDHFKGATAFFMIL